MALPAHTGSTAAVVLGGASTVGGVGLGYTFNISGMWLVVAIGADVLLLNLLIAGTIQKLNIYTVPLMLTLRYGSRATRAIAYDILVGGLLVAILGGLDWQRRAAGQDDGGTSPSHSSEGGAAVVRPIPYRVPYRGPRPGPAGPGGPLRR